jgi:hypothetical protein
MCTHLAMPGLHPGLLKFKPFGLVGTVPGYDLWLRPDTICGYARIRSGITEVQALRALGFIVQVNIIFPNTQPRSG